MGEGVAAVFTKWTKKTQMMVCWTAISTLLVPTSRVATHALLLCLDHAPSMPLQFTVRSVMIDYYKKYKQLPITATADGKLGSGTKRGQHRPALTGQHVVR
jgi:hypothetical protein